MEDYPDQKAIEGHYTINLNYGWLKLQKYFEKLNETPVYYTAILLHFLYKYFCKYAWADYPNWLIKNNTAFLKLWLQYKAQPDPLTIPSNQSQKWAHAVSGKNNYIYTNTHGSQGLINVNKYKTWNNNLVGLAWRRSKAKSTPSTKKTICRQDRRGAPV